jgi:type IV secretion system protein VirB10
MTDQTPQLSQNASEPKGVIRKNIKMFVYLGAIVLLLAASLFSSRKKTPTGTPAKGTPPQPFVQDNTANNIADLQNQLAAEKQKQQQDAQLAAAMQTPAQQQIAAMYSPNGQSTTPPQQGGQPQLSPEQEQQQQLVNKERELSFDSRFASNLAYSHSKEEELRQQLRPQLQWLLKGQSSGFPQHSRRGGNGATHRKHIDTPPLRGSCSGATRIREAAPTGTNTYRHGVFT